MRDQSFLCNAWRLLPCTPSRRTHEAFQLDLAGTRKKGTAGQATHVAHETRVTTSTNNRKTAGFCFYTYVESVSR